MVGYSKLAEIYSKQQEFAQASENLAAGRAIATRLIADHPDLPLVKEALAWFDQNIAALPTRP
jgi:hypothetical protein